MKTVLALFLLTATGLPGRVAADPVHILRCRLAVTPADGTRSEMTGNIVWDDGVAEEGAATYLTLQPPSVSDLEVDARIVIAQFRSTTYARAGLHRRGNTGDVLAWRDFGRDGFADLVLDDGAVRHTLECVPRREH
jgi:hypothetical protein